MNTIRKGENKLIVWNEERVLEEAHRFIEANQDAILRDIARVVSVKSVPHPETAKAGSPFGDSLRQALDTVLARAAEMGLTVQEDEGYVGWAEVPGRENSHIATITHLDVVPEGEGWSGDPYTLRRREGWIIGRGVTDNKGPSILCLYLAKFYRQLIQQGYPLRYSLRVLFGCSEETGMEDVKHYLQKYPQPVFCFSPDAAFPVCCGEKGCFFGSFTSAPLSGNILHFTGGEANNAVPDQAVCTVRFGGKQALPAAERITLSYSEGQVTLRAQGVGAHASTPDTGVNAIGLLVDYLQKNGLCTPEEETFLHLLQRLHGAADGSGLGIACSDQVFGALTIIGGVMRSNNGRLVQNIDCRYPTATTGEGIREKMEYEAAAAGASFALFSDDLPFYLSPESPAVQALLSSYNDTTKSCEAPFVMGGGTYARRFQHAVSFGTEWKNKPRPSFAGDIHGAEEAAKEEELFEALLIYILALHRLQGVELSDVPIG